MKESFYTIREDGSCVVTFPGGVSIDGADPVRELVVEPPNGLDPYVTLNANGSVSIQLEYPITLKNGSVVETISLRRPKGKDLEMLEKQKDSASLMLLSNLCVETIPIAALREMDLTDIIKMTSFIERCTAGKPVKPVNTGG